MSYTSLNIVIPVYNEGENIGETFSEIGSKVRTPHEIFVVYDFEEDNTLPVVRELMNTEGNIRLVKNRYGIGALNAIKTGFEAVERGVILLIMADLADDLDRVDEMLAKINEGYDIVCGSRYMKGGRQIGGPKLKKSFSKIAGISLHLLVGIPVHDITNSFKMYTKNVLNDINIESTGGFELGMEIVIKAFFKGYKVTEIPSIWRDRQSGESRFRLWRWLPNYVHWYWFAVQNRLMQRSISKIQEQ